MLHTYPQVEALKKSKSCLSLEVPQAPKLSCPLGLVFLQQHAWAWAKMGLRHQQQVWLAWPESMDLCPVQRVDLISVPVEGHGHEVQVQIEEQAVQDEQADVPQYVAEVPPFVLQVQGPGL